MPLTCSEDATRRSDLDPVAWLPSAKAGYRPMGTPISDSATSTRTSNQKGKNTAPEVELRRALRHLGLGDGLKRPLLSMPLRRCGIAFEGACDAVFVDGYFGTRFDSRCRHLLATQEEETEFVQCRYRIPAPRRYTSAIGRSFRTVELILAPFSSRKVKYASFPFWP